MIPGICCCACVCLWQITIEQKAFLRAAQRLNSMDDRLMHAGGGDGEGEGGSTSPVRACVCWGGGGYSLGAAGSTPVFYGRRYDTK